MAQATLPRELAYLNPLLVEDLARYGNARDGGYVLPAGAVAGIDAMLSFGLATDWSVERDLAARIPGLLIHAYDHSVSERHFRRARRGALVKFLRGKSSLAELKSRNAVCTGYRAFFTGPHVHYRERVFNRQDSASDATIERIFGRLEGRAHLLVKMDIEGGEYRVIPALLGFADRIDVMVIEFHDTDPLRAIFERQVKALLGAFDIVHLHGNNIAGSALDGLPEVLEITFLNKRFAAGPARRDRLPIAELDFPNDGKKPDLALSFR